jgi:hypothetical protein
MAKCLGCNKKLGLFGGYSVNNFEFCKKCYPERKELLRKERIREDEEKREVKERYEKKEKKEMKKKKENEPILLLLLVGGMCGYGIVSKSYFLFGIGVICYVVYLISKMQKENKFAFCTR